MFLETELEPLKKIANSESAAVVTFIAPDRSIRVTPSSYSSTSISTNDVYRLEEALGDSAVPDKALLLLHSPGGNFSSSYNIARFLRKRFKTLHVFVPYEAASGATIMSLAANAITLGDLGYLTPIDPQVRYKGEWVSSYGVIEKVADMERKFKKLVPDEVPVPWHQMIDRLDLIHYREMETLNYEARSYAEDLLKSAGYSPEQATDIAWKLARNIYSHGHCFDADACTKMGLKLDASAKSLGYLSEMKKLIHFANKKNTEIPSHYIDVVLPKVGVVVLTESVDDSLESKAELTSKVVRTKKLKKSKGVRRR